MILLIIGTVIVCLLIILVLERNIPSRKVFFAFCTTLFIAAGITSYSIMNACNSHETVTESTIRHITAQQQIFIEWYNPYKKKIAATDYQWTQYYQTLEEYRRESLTLQEAHDQITQIEEDVVKLNNEINQLQAPIGLDDTNYELTASLLKKTKDYSNRQLQTIKAVKEVSDPDKVKLEKREDIYQLLQNTTLSNAPDALFTAAETTALRENLTIPEID